MRKIRHRPSRGVIAACIAASSVMAPAAAQDASFYYPPYAPPSQSSVYNQNSMYLPTPPSVNGQDMIRGAGGVTCQSAVASGGPYVDLGVIGAQDVYNRDTAALYGRVVVPLGKRPDRPDCTKLYEMELARMQMELDLMRMGLPDFGGPPPPAPVRDSEPERQGAPAMINPAEAADMREGEKESAPRAAPAGAAEPSPRLKLDRAEDALAYLADLRP